MQPSSPENCLWLIIVFGSCRHKNIVKKSKPFNVHGTSFFLYPFCAMEFQSWHSVSIPLLMGSQPLLGFELMSSVISNNLLLGSAVGSSNNNHNEGWVPASI